LHVALDKLVKDGVLLGVVRRDHVNASLAEFDLWNGLNLRMELTALLKLAQTEIYQCISSLSFLEVDKRRAFDLLLTVHDVYEQKWSLGVEEHLPDVANVAALNHVVVEEHIGHLHERLVHTVLRIQK